MAKGVELSSEGGFRTVGMRMLKSYTVMISPFTQYSVNNLNVIWDLVLPTDMLEDPL